MFQFVFSFFSLSMITGRRTQLLMLEAPQPWGPWSVFYRNDDFGSDWIAYGSYGTTLPAKFHRPIINGTADMTLFFSCGNGLSGCFYTLNTVTIRLTLGITN
jgi:hypothetical protein